MGIFRFLRSSSNFPDRDRRSGLGTFVVNGPSVVSEGQQDVIKVTFNNDPRLPAMVTVCIDSGVPLKTRYKGDSSAKFIQQVARGGIITVSLETDGSTPDAQATRYAYRSTIIVNLTDIGDSSAALICIRRTVIGVLLSSVKQSNIVMRALGTALVITGVLALLGTVFGAGTRQLIAAAVTAAVGGTFIAWFSVNTLRRESRVRAEDQACQDREKRLGYG